MRKSLFVALLFICTQALFAVQNDQHFLVITGEPPVGDRGDSNHRAIFQITLPVSYTGPAYIRVFDADAGGMHDEITIDTKTRFRLYNNINLENKRSIKDTISALPLMELTIGEDERYDNQWKTIATVNAATTERIVQFVADGIDGKGTNLYRVAVSKSDFFNEPIDGATVTSLSLSLRPVTLSNISTQIYFSVPENMTELNVHLYDAEGNSTIFFESDERRFLPISHSANDETSVTKITILPSETGKRAAIIIAKNRIEQENFQIWLTDQDNRPVKMNATFEDLALNTLPKIKFFVHPSETCTEVILDASQSIDEDNDLLTIQWILPNGVVKSGHVIRHDFKTAGQYPVELIVQDNSGQVAHTSRLSKTIEINHAPLAEIILPKVAVPNEEITFDASNSTDTDGKIVDYIWEISGAGQFRGKKIKHTFKHAGVFAVKLTVVDDGQFACKTHEVVEKIWINAAPVPLITIPEKGAIGEVLSFDGSRSSDSDGKIERFTWTFSDGTVKQGVKVSHAFKTSGVHKATLEISDEAKTTNSLASIEKTLVINAEPIPLFMFNTPVSTLDENPFSADKSVDSDGKIISYVWDFGDGQRGDGKNIKHQYSSPGIYNVTLTVTDNSGTKNNQASRTETIRVNVPPTPRITANTIMTQSIANFDGSTSVDPDDDIISYEWDFGDRQTATGAKVSHVYSQNGNYNVTLSVTDASKTKTKTQKTSLKIRVNAPPIANAGPDQLTAPNAKILLDASGSKDIDGTISTYRWTLSDGASYNGASVQHQFKASGTYTAKLNITDNDGTRASDETMITVNSAPKVLHQPIPRIAPSQKFKFDASVSHDIDGKVTHVQWFFADAEKPLRGYVVERSFDEAGIVPIRIEVTDNSKAPNETSVLNTHVQINHPPKADAGADIFTDQLMVQFNAEKSADRDNDELSYTWDFGDGKTTAGAVVSHRYQKAGVFPVTLTVNDNEALSNSVQTDAMKVHINSSPSAVISAAETVCAGDPVLFDASSSKDADENFMKYEWDFGDSTKTTGVSPVHQFASSGYFLVTLTVTDNSGQKNATSKTSHLVYVTSAPVSNAGPDQSLCANTVVQFDGSKSHGGDKELMGYEWDFGDGTSGGGKNPTHVYTEAGTYTVRLTVSVADNGNCPSSSSDEMIVTVFPAPQAKFSLIEEAAENEQITFNASQSTAGNLTISDYIWDFGDGTQARGLEQSHAFAKSGIYQVKLTVKTETNQGCNTSEYTRRIRINKQPVAVISAIDSINYANEYLKFSGENSYDSDGKVKYYTWFIDGDSVSSDVEFTHQFIDARSYNLSLRVVDQTETKNNTATVSTTVLISPRILTRISGPDEICIGATASFASNNIQGRWSVNNDIASTSKSANLSQKFEKAGIYTIYFNTDDAKVSKQLIVHSHESPTLNVNTDALETGQEFSASLANIDLTKYSIEWLVNDVPFTKDATFKTNFAARGDKRLLVKITAKNGICEPIILTKTIFVFNEPVLEILVDESTLFAGGVFDNVQFKANVRSDYPNTLITWDFGDGKSAFGDEVDHSYVKSGTYSVTLKVSNGAVVNPKVYTLKKTLIVKSRK